MVVSMDRWVGKVAIVTGASSGIGAAIVDALVEHGLNVVGVARRSELVENRAKSLSGKKGKLHAFKADLSKEEDILKVFKWTSENLGPIHILINNAGMYATSTLLNGETKDWKAVFDLNVLSLCVATREAVKIMKENNIKGHIIHINSLSGHKVINKADMNVYPASKFAVTALRDSLKLELDALDLKIKITSISPGFVESEMTTENPKISSKKRALLQSLAILKSEDVADGVIYALSTPDHVQVYELTLRPVGDKYTN